MALRYITLSIFVSLAANSAAKPEDIREKVETFLSTYCYDCHDDVAGKGDLNLLDLDFNITEPDNFETWRAVYDATVSYTHLTLPTR